jgi:hypothetical protein
LSDLGLFMSNLGGVLGVVLIAVVLLRALRGNTIFPRSMRITVSTVGLFFVFLASAGVLALPVPDRFVSYLRISHAFLAGFLAAGLWHRDCPVRLKLAVTFFATPIVLQTATMFFERMGWSPFLVFQGGRLAEASAFFALLLSPALIPPRPRRGFQVAAMLGAGLISLSPCYPWPWCDTSAWLRWWLFMGCASTCLSPQASWARPTQPWWWQPM